jgi:UDP-N-acetylglucosamine--N-acetylmuramyl-(pentapeptide) pyrophosphoryl-undecaprenol N-acetylglucosamine transferase
MNNPVRILMAGGGTGGHIYPLVAVTEKLQEQAIQQGINLQVLYFGSAGDYQQAVENAGMRVVKISASKMRRYFSFLNFLDFFKFGWSLIQSWWKIFWYMPDVAFTKGGPGTLPIVFFCRWYRIPVLTHESDSIPSLTTKISNWFSKKLYISFYSTQDRIQSKNLDLVGNPVRSEFFKNYNTAAAKTKFGLNPNEPLVFFWGGSQGAEKINDFVADYGMTGLTERNIQVLHQTGRTNFNQYSAEYNSISARWSPELKKKYHIVPFLEEDLSGALSAADIIVSRAGSGSIFEIAAVGKPALLIPYPFAAQNHQFYNASEYTKTGAGTVILEENLLPSVIFDQIEKLIADKDRYDKMAAAAKQFSKPEAANLIAKDLLSFAT